MSAVLTEPPSAQLSIAAIQVRFFGQVADVCGRNLTLRIGASGCRLSEVKAQLCATVEGAGEALAAPGVRAAIAQIMVIDDGAWVRAGDEVAFFSAFSGG